MHSRSETPGFETKASPGLWFAALAGFAVHVIFTVAMLPGGGKNGADQVGTFVGRVLGALFWPLVIVGIASLWRSNRTQKRRVRVFFIASVALVALQLISVLAIFGLMTQLRNAQPSHPWEYHSQEHGFSLALPSSGWKQSAQKPTSLIFRPTSLRRCSRG